MNGPKRIRAYCSQAFIEAREWFWLVLLNAITSCILLAFLEAWLLVFVIILIDVLRFAIGGAWGLAPQNGHPAPPDLEDCNPAYDFISLAVYVLKTMTVISFGLLWPATHVTPSHATTVIYVIASTTAIEAMREILLTIQHYDAGWLAGTNGKIGIANWLSIVRIGIAIVLPHLFFAKPFGSYSIWIELTLLGICFVTDALDGLIARRTKTETRAGRYLDPLGDKILFIPLGITFVLLALIGDRPLYYRGVTLICVTIAVVRDILFFIWFFTKRKQLTTSIKAGLADKIRMILICAWLGDMALGHFLGELGKLPSYQQAPIVSLVLVILVATASVVSIIVDIGRVKKTA